MVRNGLALSLALAGLLVGCGGQEKDPAAKTAPPTDRVRVGTGPVGVTATASGDVWVAVAGADQVVRVSAGGRRPEASVPVDGTPLRLTAEENGSALWVSAFRRGEVARVDATTARVTDRVAVGAGAEGVADAFGSVWVAVQDDGLLVRIDPVTRRVVRKVPVGSGVRLVVPGAGALWLDDHPGGSVVRVDPRTYRVSRSGHVCDGPEDVAVVGTTVWVTCSGSEELVALRADDLTTERRVALPGTPDAVTAAPDGSLLVALQDGPTLVRLDGASGSELSRTRLGKRPQLHDQANLDIAVDGDDAWVTSFSDGSVLRTRWRR